MRIVYMFLIGIIILFLILFLSPLNVMAQTPLGYTPCGATEMSTAIGCIQLDSTQHIAEFFLPWAMGIAGGIAFILIIIAAFMVLSSGGNMQRLAAGKELLTAAITGLLLLLFSAFILEFIGVDILNLPGF